MAQPAAPDKDLREQRNSALERANATRVARAKLKQELRNGQVQIAVVLVASPPQVTTTRVVDLLVAVPRIGPVKAARLLKAARVGHMKTVGELTGRQRARLVELLAEPGRGEPPSGRHESTW
jgi:hypothetical protein